MPSIQTLQNGVRRVGRFRQCARIGSGLSVFGAIVLWLLFAMFLLDLAMKTGMIERVLLLVSLVAVSVWSIRRHVMPMLAQRENPVTIAAMVERQQGIPSDLVAALEFSEEGRAQFGSAQMRAAVVQDTAATSRKIDYLEGFSRPELWRRLAIVSVTIVIVGSFMVWQGENAAIFLQRMLLQNAAYPTDTLIVEVVAPGNKVVYGQPVEFRVRAGGVLPANGKISVTAKSGAESQIEILPGQKEDSLFVGQLEIAMEDMTYTIRLGDAVSLPMTLEVIPLPMVEMHLDVEIPEYARHRFEETGSNSRSRVVLEGTTVTPTIRSTKTLKSVVLTVNNEPVQTAPAKEAKEWKLAIGQDSEQTNPFAELQETIHYRVEVEDQDGIRLDRPIGGVIQVKPDLPPRIAAASVLDLVLPNAIPRIKFRAVDDFSLGAIDAKIVLSRDGQEFAEKKLPIAFERDNQPIMDLDSVATVNLADFALEIGDLVTLTLIATDDRGNRQGESAQSDPLVFEVTSRAGFLAAMRKVDAQTDEKLDKIIQAQLGIGD